MRQFYISDSHATYSQGPINRLLTPDTRTYFFVSYIKVAAQNNRFLFVKGFQIFSEVFIPSLSIAKPKRNSKN